jgi:hypothetical protein
MKYIFTFLMLTTFMLFSTAQVVLQDFTNQTNNANADVYGGFGNGLTTDNSLVDDPLNASNKVRQLTTAAGGDSWKGIFVRPQTHYYDLTTTKKFTQQPQLISRGKCKRGRQVKLQLS